MKTIREILLDGRRTGLAGIASLAVLLAGCATTIHGHVDASYVPIRVAETAHRDEIRTEVDLHTETPIGKNKLTIGESIITYMNFVNPAISGLGADGGLFNPNSADYVSYLRFLVPLSQFQMPDRYSLELYALHDCFHPIGQNALLDLGSPTYIIESTGETRFGIKLDF